MSLGQKFVSALRNAFSYAVYFESADDRTRKADVIQKLVDFSAPVVAASGDAGYEDRLRATLKESRTKFLDTLVEKQVAVGLDARLAKQVQAGNDNSIDGVFYVGPQGAAAGGLVSLYDAGKPGLERQNGLLVEKLGRLLKDVTPAVDLFAFSTTTIAVGGEGTAALVNITEWEAANGNLPVAKANPALKQAPVKAANAPKPN